MELTEVVKPKMYTTQEVANFMVVPYARVYRMIKNGKIKATDIAPPGSKKAIFLVRAEDVQAYYDQLSNTNNGAKNINE